MLMAMLNTAMANTSEDLPFNLDGDWLPTRCGEWYNRLPGKHSNRARDRNTKMTYDRHGNGSGWVGEVYVDVKVRCVAPGRYTSSFKVRRSAKTLAWSANDGTISIEDDGSLLVQYPSKGIREYWVPARAPRRQAWAMPPKASRDVPTRSISCVFRRFGDGLGWHWGIQVGESIYEVNGAMAVMGPKGIVAASSPFLNTVHTQLHQFDGYVAMPQRTQKTDEEIEEFSRRWVKLHPVYKALGPNCQTYADDLFAFLTGEGLPYAKFSDKAVGKGGASDLPGPEADTSAQWLNSSKKPANVH